MAKWGAGTKWGSWNVSMIYHQEHLSQNGDTLLKGTLQTYWHIPAFQQASKLIESKYHRPSTMSFLPSWSRRWCPLECYLLKAAAPVKWSCSQYEFSACPQSAQLSLYTSNREMHDSKAWPWCLSMQRKTSTLVQYLWLSNITTKATSDSAKLLWHFEADLCYMPAHEFWMQLVAQGKPIRCLLCSFGQETKRTNVLHSLFIVPVR